MNHTRTIPLTTKLGYGIGQMSEGALTITFSLFVLFFYTQLLGIPGYYTGAALFIALIFDAITDPWMGVISDQWCSKWGRRHPFMFFSAIPLAISFYFLFSPPEALLHSDLGLAIWLACFAILTRLCMTLFNVPYLSLGAELTQDFKERTKIVGYRYAFANIGVIATIMIGFQLFFAPTPEFKDGQMNPAAYPPFALSLGIFMAIVILISVFSTRKEVPFLLKLPRKNRNLPVIDILRDDLHKVQIASKNHSFRALFFSLVIAYVMVGIINNLNFFMATFFWELNVDQIAIVSSAIFLGILGGVFFTSVLHQHFDKRQTVIYSVIGWVTFLILPTSLRLLNWFPENGSSELFWVLTIFRVLEGLCLVQAAVSFGSMLADIADEHALLTGRREEGIFFGASSFASKCSDGLGTLAAGIIIDVIHLPSGANVQVADIQADTLFQLGLFYGPFMIIFAIAALWFCSHYALTREKHEFILQQLTLRKEQID